MKVKLSLLKVSLAEGYLPSDFIQQLRDGESLVRTDSGYIALSCNIVETNEGYVWHEDQDDNEYSFDEVNEVYINTDNAVWAYGRRGRQYTTTIDICEEFRGEYYITDYLSDNDIYRLHDDTLCHSDDCHFVESEGEYYHDSDCYYWDSDGQYHLEEENTDNTLFGYHSGPSEKDFRFEDSEGRADVFGWGIEIEKGEMPGFDFNKDDLYRNTGAVIEQDSSVCDGFELKTPIYNLFSPKTDERLTALKDFCNVKNVKNAGGHIGFSMAGKNDEELLDLCRGFLPLIYAMHKKRLFNDYCKVKTINDLKADGSKYQAIRLRGNYIEFRIFSSVKTFRTIEFRLELFRIIASNLGASFGKVCLMAIDINHPLHKLLTRVYNTRKAFQDLIETAIIMDRDFGTNRLTQKAVNNISDRIRRTFVEKEVSPEDKGIMGDSNIIPASDCDFIE